MTLPAGKPEWRARISRARRARPEAELAASRAAIGLHLVAFLADLPGFADLPGLAGPLRQATSGADTSTRTICAYAPMASEPLDPGLTGLLVRRGFRVLLPVVLPGEPLDWAEAGPDTGPEAGQNAGPEAGLDTGPGCPPESGSLRAGPLGVSEPTGRRLGPEAVTSADLVIVPALAVDVRGVRLGRGGGFYDRTLAILGSAGSHQPIVAVLFDDEYVPHLPSGEFDIPVTHVVTPAGGVRAIAAG